MTYDEWKDHYGLLNPEKNTPTENAILVTLQYDLLNKAHLLLTYSLILRYFQTTTDHLYTQTHYGKKADHGEEGLEPNSHDNITAIAVTMKLIGAEHRVKGMWSYMLRNLFTYDFRSPNKINVKRILHPRDIIFYGYLARNPVCILLMPLLIIPMLFSCLKPKEKTSGKLLWWLRCHCLPKPFFWLFHKLVDYKEAFRIYYYQEGHPIKELL